MAPSFNPSDSPITDGIDPLDDLAGAPDDEPSAEEIAALHAEIPDGVEVTHVGSGGSVESADDGHGCPGKLESWIYVDDAGSTHLVWTVWYECESLLEIASDVTVP